LSAYAISQVELYFPELKVVQKFQRRIKIRGPGLLFSETGPSSCEDQSGLRFVLFSSNGPPVFSLDLVMAHRLPGLNWASSCGLLLRSGRTDGGFLSLFPAISLYSAARSWFSLLLFLPSSNLAESSLTFVSNLLLDTTDDGGFTREEKRLKRPESTLRMPAVLCTPSV
jgi:hypothetical protein